MIALLSAVGFQISRTCIAHFKGVIYFCALETFRAVFECKVTGCLFGKFFSEEQRRLWQSFLICSLSFLNTCSLCATEVELYTCIIACGAPLTASNVLLIICSLACVST